MGPGRPHRRNAGLAERGGSPRSRRAETFWGWEASLQTSPNKIKGKKKNPTSYFIWKRNAFTETISVLENKI